jgi:hypothetical protein
LALKIDFFNFLESIFYFFLRLLATLFSLRHFGTF